MGVHKVYTSSLLLLQYEERLPVSALPVSLGDRSEDAQQ